MSEESKNKRRGRPLLFFYLLVIYVFTSFIWWSYLLKEKNKLAFDSQIEMERIHHVTRNGLPAEDASYFNTPHYQNIKLKYERQKWMIIGEGTVFLLLLGIGTYTIYGTFTREILLARQQNNFLLSITHELKSPLASIKLSLQTLFKRVTMEDRFMKLVSNSMDDVERLEVLVDNILLAAKVESSDYTYRMEQTDLSSMTEAMIDRMQMNHPDRIFNKEIEYEINMDMDRMTFSSVITNLVENAVKYSPAGAPVYIKLYKDEDEHIVLQIKDEGAGIPDKEKARIFRKFYRIGSESTRTTKGTGLGLFIVKRVVDNHGGKVEVTNNTPKGTVFTITLAPFAE